MSKNFVNKIFCGNCQNIMAQYIPDNSIDLIYADPPFFTEKKYEVIWGDGYEIRAYEDRWKGGIQNYLAWMEPKLRECHRVLKPTGSIYLHCDWHANAHLRILMDKIFGENYFRNEIIWYYRGGGVPKNDFAKRHATILRYTKSNKCTFNVDDVRDHYSTDSLERLQYVARAFRGEKVYDNYRPNPKGKHPDDVWLIQPTMPSSKERLGYPTQKPAKLLDRIIKASSNPMDVVLDPFCGCGTAIAVAHKRGRRWIGIDVSPTACKLMFKRLQKLCPTLKFEETVIGMPKTIEELRALQPFEFQNWVVQKLGGRVSAKKIGDMGIDGFTFDLKPIQVKQSDNVGRTVVDNFETAMHRVKAKRGIIVALSFGKGAYEEVARAKMQDGLEIELTTVNDLTEKFP
jgi:DNA modification methylase